MGFKRKYVSLIILFLGIFALSSALNADAQQPAINPFCTEGDVIPAVRVQCAKVVGSATKWDQAALYSVRRIARKANQTVKPLLATIDAKLVDTLPASARSHIVEVCRKSYEEAMEHIQKCPSLITVGPFSSYASTLTSIYTSFDDCKDAIVQEKEQPEIYEVTKFTRTIHRLLDVALIISSKDPRVEEYNNKLDQGEIKDSAGNASLIGPIAPTA